jgi:hypothetical protein
MKTQWTPRYTIVSMLVLSFVLGLAFLLIFTPPTAAGPADVTPLPPVEETDGRAGACFSYYPDLQTGTGRPFVQPALDVGSRWDRFDFAWPRFEPANNQWDPVVLDGYDTLVDDLHDAGMNMVGILLWTPDWAAMSGAPGGQVPSFDQRPARWYALTSQGVLVPAAVAASSSPPQGLYLNWADPDNHWGDFVYTIVSRYGDRVKHWEIWNEPEWSYFWTGTSTDYARLLKVGYKATKAACPDCTVLFGGLHYWINPSFYRWVLGVINTDPAAPQYNYFFDVMSVHLYSRSSSIYDEVNNIRSGMSAYNVADHPIWLTETGVPVWGDAPAYNPKYDFAARKGQAAAYVIQSYANAWASGVERYFFFRVHDSDMSESFGLIRNDHSLRPAYVAYQVATSYLISPTFVTHGLVGSHRSVTLWGTPRGKVSVLWNRSPVAGVYTFPAVLPTATFMDRWGVTRTVTATSILTGTGVYYAYTATLPGAEANLVSNPDDYIIGGDPLIVVESETPNQPPTSTVHPLPAVTLCPSFTVTWSGYDNQSGIWMYDVQVRDGANGEWVGWQYSTPVTFGQFTGQYDHTYYFRSRATDRLGNRAPWPEAPQAHTTLGLSGTLQVSVGAFFADENRNGVWDDPIMNGSTIIFEEITLTQVSLHLYDGSGYDVITPVVTRPWSFTTTIYYRKQPYRLWAATVDSEYVRTFPITCTWSEIGAVYTRTYEALGLWPTKRVYLPLVLRGG